MRIARIIRLVESAVALMGIDFQAHVAELVDAHGSGPCAARCGGSSPSVGTKVFSANLA